MNNLISCPPPIPWAGGKTSELQKIHPLLPFHSRYFEPFFGGGSVYFDSIATKSFGNDTNSNLCDFYRCIKNQDIKFFDTLNLFCIQYNACVPTVDVSAAKELYLEVRDKFNAQICNSNEKAAYFYILISLGYASLSIVNKKNKFTNIFAKNVSDFEHYITRLRKPALIKKVTQLTLCNLDFESFLNQYQFCNTDFMFVDPPYDSPTEELYHQVFSVKDHERLSNLLLKFQGKFMLIVNYTELMKTLYTAKHLITYLYMKKYSMSASKISKPVQHAMIVNYNINELSLL